MNQYISESEVAKRFGISQRRVSKFRRAGLIRGVKMDRSYVYRERDIDAFFDEFIGKDLSAEHYMVFKKGHRE